MVEEKLKIALIGSPGAGKTTAAEYLKKWFSPIDVFDDEAHTERDYWDAVESLCTIVRVVADQDKRAARTNNSDVGEDPLAGLRADYTVFNQGTRDLLYNQLIEVIYQEVAKT